MKTNHIRTSASLKLFVGILMAACFVVTPAHAKDRPADFAGTFVLTTDVQWGKALLRPGTYSLTVHGLDQTTESIIVRDASDDKIVVSEVTAINPNTDGYVSQLLIVSEGTHRAVSSLELPGMGMVFHQAHPFATSEPRSEEARNTQAIPVQTATK
ncbi:MAG: hypothetical protein ABSA32_06295 [Candidatus Acidiferrales bacterium]|jgi:hypothetical protein